MLSAGVWDREERVHWSRNKRNNRKTGSVEAEGWRVAELSGPWRASWILGAKRRPFEPTAGDLCISVTRYDLHVEQIVPAAFGSPEPVGCHGEGIISQS